MKWVLLAIAVCLGLLVLLGHRPVETAVLLVYHGGNEYEILDRGDLFDGDKASRYIRYYSKAPFNGSVRSLEEQDLLAVVARHINTNRHQQVMITAVEKDERYFGLIKPREHTSVFSIEDTLKSGDVKKTARMKKRTT